MVVRMKKQYAWIIPFLSISLLVFMTGCTASPSQSEASSTASPSQSEASSTATPASQVESDEPAQTSSDFPNKPINWIIQAGPGGGLDTTARLLANVAQKYTNVNIVVENIEGGGGAVAITQLANSAPDGYTIGLIYSTVLCDQYLREDVVYNEDSFDYICQVNSDPSMLITKSGGKYDVSLPELVEMAKTEKLTVGVPGTWLCHDFNRMFLMDSAGIEFVRIGYDGGGSLAVAGVAAGDVDVAYCLPSEWISYYEAGEMSGIAVSANERLAAFADVPTFAEQGFDYSLTLINRVIVTPKGLPQDVKDTLENIFMEALADPELSEAYMEVGMAVDAAGSAEAKADILEMSNAYNEFLREYNIQPNDVPW